MGYTPPLGPRCFCGAVSVGRKARYGWLYECIRKGCDGKVGTHPDSKKPLGSLADGPTRDARRRAHEAVDPLWKERKPWNRRRYRVALYRYLASVFEVEVFHIGETTEEEANRLLALAKDLTPEALEPYLP